MQHNQHDAEAECGEGLLQGGVQSSQAPGQPQDCDSESAPTPGQVVTRPERTSLRSRRSQTRSTATSSFELLGVVESEDISCQERSGERSGAGVCLVG